MQFQDGWLEEMEGKAQEHDKKDVAQQEKIKELQIAVDKIIGFYWWLLEAVDKMMHFY